MVRGDRGLGFKPCRSGLGHAFDISDQQVWFQADRLRMAAEFCRFRSTNGQRIKTFDQVSARIAEGIESLRDDSGLRIFAEGSDPS